MKSERTQGPMGKRSREAAEGGISRRRLLKLAAYSVPAASVLTVCVLASGLRLATL